MVAITDLQTLFTRRFSDLILAGEMISLLNTFLTVYFPLTPGTFSFPGTDHMWSYSWVLEQWALAKVCGAAAELCNSPHSSTFLLQCALCLILFILWPDFYNRPEHKCRTCAVSLWRRLWRQAISQICSCSPSHLSVLFCLTEALLLPHH